MKHLKTSRSPISQQAYVPKPPENLETIGGTVTVQINGETITVPFGTTILEACRMADIYIPTLCAHEDLGIGGHCRLCLVDVEGMRTLQASCAFPITSPIKVKTSTTAVRKARKHIMELLLSEHVGECYACVKNGNCELQTLAKELGVDHFTFGHRTESKFPVDRSSYSVIRDMDKCINCRRCVRTCIDLQEVGCLEAIGRVPKPTSIHL